MIRTWILAALAAAIAAPSAFAQQENRAQGNVVQGSGAQGYTTQPNAAQQTAAQGHDATPKGVQGSLVQGPGGATPIPAQRTPAQGQGTAGRMGVNDALFAAAAATGGLAEVSLSELGVQKATDPELKRFSQQMVAEHTRMNQELMTLAAQQRIPLPRGVDARAQFCAESLAGLSGEEFDRCYAKAQLVAHMDSVAAFEAEAERGQDSAMKALAARTLPHIKDHLKMVKPIAQRYEEEKPSTSGAASEKRER
jgi:putative membrane protein